MDSPINWMGGKNYLREKIISYIPAHKTYVEPFLGSGWVFFAKPRSHIEIVNDINGDLVNLYRCIRDIPGVFLQELKNHINSEEIFKEYLIRLGYTDPTGYVGSPPVDLPSLPFSNDKLYPERARMFYYILMNAFNGILKESPAFGVDKLKEPGFCKFYKTEWTKVTDRLKKVAVLYRDFGSVIKSYDAPETFFYCDPPYMITLDRDGHYYRDPFSLEDHQRLRKSLSEAKGTWILSYDRDDRVLDLYSEFHIMEVDVKYGEGVELLISNKEFELGPYTAEMSPVVERNGRWDYPVCPSCRSLKVQYVYFRTTLEGNKRNYAHDPSDYKCMNCGRLFQFFDQKGSPDFEQKTFEEFQSLIEVNV